jgi:hypothetical protein
MADASTGDGWRIETARPRDLTAEAVAAWGSLAARALEPNPFMEADYVLAAAQHLPEGRHVVLILIWQGATLHGVLPTVAPRLPLPRRSARLWEVPLAGAGTPLLDRATARPALAAALGFLARPDTRVESLALPGLTARGPLAALLAAAPDLPGARWTGRPGPSRRFLRPAASARVTGSGVRDAVEVFLALDAARAERRWGPGLLQDPASATFVRAATRRFAARDACTVELDVREGRAVGATLLLGQGEGARPWLAATGPRLLAPDRVDALLPLSALARAA